jgi:heme exporter protein C
LLIYVAYGMLRGSIEGPERQARFAAVYGIVAFVTVPLSWFAIRWWRTIHPDILTGGEGMALTPRMIQTLIASIGAFTVLYATLLRQRIRLENARDTLTRLRLIVERVGPSRSTSRRA